MLRKFVLAALLSVPAVAMASLPPAYPHFSSTTIPSPNVYKMAPIPPLLPVLMQHRQSLGVTPAQLNTVKNSMLKNEEMMMQALGVDKTLHEDVLNGITGKPLQEAETGVLNTQKMMLGESVKMDETILHVLSPKQRAELVADYRQLETQNMGTPSPQMP